MAGGAAQTGAGGVSGAGALDCGGTEGGIPGGAGRGRTERTVPDRPPDAPIPGRCRSVADGTSLWLY